MRDPAGPATDHGSPFPYRLRHGQAESLGWHDRLGQLLCVRRQRQHNRVVLFNQWRQVRPQLGIWVGEINMATPYPRCPPSIMLNRKRLRIVNDHHVVVEVVADRIFVGHFFINPSLEFSNIDAGPLQTFLVMLKKSGRPGSHANRCERRMHS